MVYHRRGLPGSVHAYDQPSPNSSSSGSGSGDENSPPPATMLHLAAPLGAASNSPPTSAPGPAVVVTPPPTTTPTFEFSDNSSSAIAARALMDATTCVHVAGQLQELCGALAAAGTSSGAALHHHQHLLGGTADWRAQVQGMLTARHTCTTSIASLCGGHMAMAILSRANSGADNKLVKLAQSVVVAIVAARRVKPTAPDFKGAVTAAAAAAEAAVAAGAEFCAGVVNF